MSKQGPETKLVNKMRDDANAEYGDGVALVKNHGSEYSAAGVSDLTGCLWGRFVAVEVKAPETYGGSVERALRKGPTVKQRLFVARVLAAGGSAGFAATREQFMEVLACAAANEPCGVDQCLGHNIVEVE